MNKHRARDPNYSYASPNQQTINPGTCPPEAMLSNLDPFHVTPERGCPKILSDRLIHPQQ